LRGESNDDEKVSPLAYMTFPVPFVPYHLLPIIGDPNLPGPERRVPGAAYIFLPEQNTWVVRSFFTGRLVARDPRFPMPRTLNPDRVAPPWVPGPHNDNKLTVYSFPDCIGPLHPNNFPHPPHAVTTSGLPYPYPQYRSLNTPPHPYANTRGTHQNTAGGITPNTGGNTASQTTGGNTPTTGGILQSITENLF